MTTTTTTAKPRPRAPERVLAMGVTGSGKTYAWLKMARRLLPTGAIFRCIDTDNAIDFMLENQFPDLLPENGGNVFVSKAFSWDEYELCVRWVKQKDVTPEELKAQDPYWQLAYKKKIKPNDWVIVDMADNAWTRVASYFTEQVYGKNMGQYFLQLRKTLLAQGDKVKNKAGKMVPVTSIAKEAFDGWKDWTVINKLYDDFMLPVIYQVPCNVFLCTKVEEVDRNEKDAETRLLYGEIGVKPGGQKRIGHQSHTIFLMIPGKRNWMITTIKDRGNRGYFDKTPLTDFYNQYFCAKAGWDYMPNNDPKEEVQETQSEDEESQEGEDQEQGKTDDQLEEENNG